MLPSSGGLPELRCPDIELFYEMGKKIVSCIVAWSCVFKKNIQFSK